MNTIPFTDSFVARHCGHSDSDLQIMYDALGISSLNELIDQTIPADIRLADKLNIEDGISEYEFLEYIHKLSKKNQIAKSYIGMGYYSTITPAVIRRNVFENPGWYTQYTPYQAEISQGRLEALMNFQTMITDLTALPIANASLLDEATAASEAMNMLFSHSRITTKSGNKFFVSGSVFPQTIDVLLTRALPLGIEVEIGDWHNFIPSNEYFGCLLQFPDSNGSIISYEEFINKCKHAKVYTVAAADLLSLTILKPPGEFGVDVCVGSSQRFGIPMGYGGPHAAFFACTNDFKRLIPGRIIGASIDINGSLAYRMALQTREQHIKRDKATSNICTSQVLLSVMASLYAVYHGPSGLRNIAKRIHSLAYLLDYTLSKFGYKQLNAQYFDTLYFHIDKKTIEEIQKRAAIANINFRYVLTESAIGISIGENTTVSDIKEIISVVTGKNIKDTEVENILNKGIEQSAELDYAGFNRQTPFLTHKNFNSFHTETELTRYIKRLENKDLSLTTSMIPLGSCTMKLNAAAEMLGVSLPGFANIHPFAPTEQTEGYRELIQKLSSYLSKITGFPGVSLQPNSGAQGEYAGLMVIRQYLIETNQKNRNIVLIPASAHGTNPASAVLAGMKVIVARCDEHGNIDLTDLLNKAIQYKENLAALMVTYPSTHGVFETKIKEICAAIHDAGGLVYMDGANMNAQVGLTMPSIIGADVCHLNLHKTFAIPHGGGGPGVGPICVSEKLKPYLPGHSVIPIGNEKSMSAVSAAPYGSASVLVISLGYIMMMGRDGLAMATKTAILNANYLKARLEPHYKVLYAGEEGRVGHELIFDFREFKKTANIEVEDVAKRLMDYGYHAPTVSFPVAGTLMIEPTESESKAELDKFIEAMISIKQEISEIESGLADKVDNVLKNAPHTAQTITSDTWEHKYSRQKAAYPVKYLQTNKFWPSVSRVNNAYGDRNLVCSCNSIEEYISEK